ncbi:MAG TPA: VWA domain-containing protein [Pyrinomonadaceae bacterium]|jgi:Ca-activated chloride channel family protein|nr:VWA domain-containing protein [Pyrinomonadaceae bacterium]
MRTQKPRPHRFLFLLGLTLVACCGVGRAQVSNTQTQPPATAMQTPAPATPQTMAQPASAPVRLNVIVSGESKGVAADLRPEDFRVEEDGVPQTITHFARAESPVSYTLVVDNSGSLRGVLDDILRACAALVAANRPGDETSLTRFVGRDQITVPQDFTAEQWRLNRGLESMYVEGGQTAIIDAVYLSAERVAARRTDEAGRRRALVLLTDGEDRASRYKLSELQKLLRKHDVQVFVIGVVSVLDKGQSLLRAKGPREKATAFLNGLAQETGGRAFFPKNAKEMQAAVAEIARDLRTQYAISYQTSNANRDGKFRKIQVKLSEAAGSGKRTVHARSGYFAPDAQGAKEK